MTPKRTRRRYKAEFKTEVALATLIERQPWLPMILMACPLMVTDSRSFGPRPAPEMVTVAPAAA